MKSQSSLPQSVGATHEFVSWVLEPNTEPGKWICQLGIEVLVLWYILSWIHSIHQIHSKCIEIDTVYIRKQWNLKVQGLWTLNTGSPNLTLYNLRCSQRVSHTESYRFEMLWSWEFFQFFCQPLSIRIHDRLIKHCGLHRFGSKKKQ